MPSWTFIGLVSVIVITTGLLISKYHLIEISVLPHRQAPLAQDPYSGAGLPTQPTTPIR